MMIRKLVAGRITISLTFSAEPLAVRHSGEWRRKTMEMIWFFALSITVRVSKTITMDSVGRISYEPFRIRGDPIHLPHSYGIYGNLRQIRPQGICLGR